MMQPHVSIILPVRNEERFITSCLKSIAAQDYPHDQMEILVVEGLSTDSTVKKIEEFRIQNTKLRILVLENQKQTVSAGRNIALRASKGDLVMCMDAHALYSPDYISSCVEVMEATGAANVGGHMRALPADNTALAYASVLANDSPFGLGGGRFHDPSYEGFAETVWMGCYKKEALNKVGLYDERRTRTEDIDLNRRLIEAGYKIYLSPKIKAWYFPRANLTDLWRQRWADGCEITRFLPDNPKAPKLRHFIPLIFVSSLILLTALSLSGLGASLWGRGAGTKLANLLHGFNGFSLKQPGLFSLKAWSWHLLFLRMLALELFAYFSAMLFFLLQSGKHKHKTDSSACKAGGKSQNDTPDKDSIFSIQNSEFSPGSLALLPVVFLTLHFSYGLGSLWGLVTLPFWLARNQK